MTYPFRFKLTGVTVLAIAIALLFAVAFPTPVSAILGGPDCPDVGDNPSGGLGCPGGGGGNQGNGNGNNGNGNGDNGNGNGDNGNGDNGNGNNGKGENPDINLPTLPENGGMNGDMKERGPHVSALSNRIVLHAATPAQLVKAGDGLQYFYIGADGSTVSGPTFPSFAELAEMHPSGEWVSLLNAINPLSGKQVYVDYIPNEQKIRVFTYYLDKGPDVNKPYIFNFGSDYAINVEAW